MSNKCRCHMRIRNGLSLAISWAYPRFSMRSALLIFLVFCFVCFALFVLVLYIVTSVASAYGSFILDCQLFCLMCIYEASFQAINHAGRMVELRCANGLYCHKKDAILNSLGNCVLKRSTTTNKLLLQMIFSLNETLAHVPM